MSLFSVIVVSEVTRDETRHSAKGLGGVQGRWWSVVEFLVPLGSVIRRRGARIVQHTLPSTGPQSTAVVVLPRLGNNGVVSSQSVRSSSTAWWVDAYPRRRNSFDQVREPTKLSYCHSWLGER